MIYYSVAFLCYLALIGPTYFHIIKLRTSIMFFSLLPLILLVILRGNVGTDTASYLSLINEISASGSVAGIEYGFIYLVKALLYFTNSHMLILVLIALFTTAILLSASKSTDRALFVFIICIVPIFYLDMTMNGLRYGLSFSCAMYAISKFYQRRLLLSCIWGIFAVLFHISGFLLFLIVALLADDEEELKKWVALIIVFLLVVFVQLYALDITNYINQIGTNNINLNGKYIVYQQFKSPSWFSGLAPMGILLALLYILQRSNRESPVLSARHFYILLALICLMFAIAKFSYAGLRLQSLVLFAMLVMLQFKPGFSGMMDKKVKSGIFFVGCLGLLAFIKCVIQTEGQGISPFSPWFINPAIKQLWTFIYG